MFDRNNVWKSRKANKKWTTGKLWAATTDKDAKTWGRKRLEAKQVLLAPSSWSPSSLSVPGGPQTSGTSVCLRISVHLWPSLTVPGGHRPEQEDAGRPPGTPFLHFLSAADCILYIQLHVHFSSWVVWCTWKDEKGKWKDFEGGGAAPAPGEACRHPWTWISTTRSRRPLASHGHTSNLVVYICPTLPTWPCAPQLNMTLLRLPIFSKTRCCDFTSVELGMCLLLIELHKVLFSLRITIDQHYSTKCLHKMWLFYICLWY